MHVRPKGALRRAEEGFTLVELLVVLALIGILAAIATIGTKAIRGKSIKSACKSDYKTVELAIEAYYTKWGVYATSTEFTSGATLLGTAGLPSNEYSFTVSGSGITVVKGSSRVQGGPPTGAAGIAGCDLSP